MSEPQVYDWDSKIENPAEGGSDFVLLPAGVYPYKVTAFERAQHPGSANLPSCPKAVVTLVVGNGQASSSMRNNFFLYTTTMGMITAFFTSCGLRKHGEILDCSKFSQAIGKTGYCRVDVRDFVGKDGKKKRSNEIKVFLDEAEGAEKYAAQERAGGPAPLPAAEPDVPSWKPENEDEIPF